MMSDALLGVIIGGLIASVGQIAALVIQYRKWKVETRLQHLHDKRLRLESMYRGALKNVLDGMVGGSYDIETIAEFDFLFPSIVLEEFQRYIQDSDKSEQARRFHYYAIARTMKASLAAIDKEIESLVS